MGIPFDKVILDLDGDVINFINNVNQLSNKFDSTSIIGDLVCLIVNNEHSFDPLYHINEYIAYIEFNVDELLGEDLSEQDNERLPELAKLTTKLAESLIDKKEALKLFPQLATNDTDYKSYSLANVTNKGDLILELVEEHYSA